MPSGIYIRTKEQKENIRQGVIKSHSSLDVRKKIGEATKILWRKGILKGGWHHTEKTKNKISQKNKGKAPYLITDKIRKRMSKVKQGKHYSIQTEFKKGHFQPKEWVNEQKIKVSGKNNWNWKGGKLSYRPTIGTKYWDNIRRKIYKRDNWTCQICGCKNKPVQVHHIIPYRWWINLKWADHPSNLIALCCKCHMKEDRAIDKIIRGS